ncbi:protein DEK-like [Bolinopsis microptera]|uniref:protein DEK-like n=1 Tax=Bolinopsis microptera TaxID=2820187 RepID=UPI003078C263
MSKTHSDSYISMHRLMYNSQGVSLQRKGNVRRFNGFNFDEDSKLYSSKLTSIKKMKSVDRKLSMKLLGLNQNSTMQELMDFLMSPEDKGRHAPSKKKSKTPSKRRRSTTKDDEGKTTPAKKKSSAKSKPKTTPKRKKATPKKRDTDDEVEGDDSLSESESVSEDNDLETNTITNPTKKRKLSESITDISKDDSFSGPTDEDLIGAIKKTVENIDLEEVSMKDALKKIYGLYPGVDLTDRKSFIKDNIRKLIG